MARRKIDGKDQFSCEPPRHIRKLKLGEWSSNKWWLALPVVKFKKNSITQFNKCPALDGSHCQTNSLAKMFHYHDCPLSEDMLLGLGAGMGFMYWHQKGIPPFIGGRGNVKNS